MQQKLQSIAHPLFVSCLFILLLNDFHLKAAFHNALTGKLSDFCGLLVFAWFWSAVLPGKKRAVYFSTALLFVLWKSPYAAPFIDLFSQYVYPITRVVDVTDLWALLVLPFGFFYSDRTQWSLKMNPVPLAFLSLFAFAATSLPSHYQTFEQPQYLLFKAGLKDYENAEYPVNYQAYHQDSFLIIAIQSIEIQGEPPKEDEFQKVEILKGLDFRFLTLAEQGYYLEGDPFPFQDLQDSLSYEGKTSLTLNLDSIIDYLNFKGTRLDGHFKRLSKDSVLLIDGQYQAGVEDSIWTFYNKENRLIRKKFFQGGELTKVEEFENGVLKSKKKLSTRRISIWRKVFHLSVLLLLMIGIAIKIYQNFKHSKQNNHSLKSHFEKISAALILPILTFCLAQLLSLLIPDASNLPFIQLVLEAIVAYFILALLYLLIFYGLKLRARFDLLWYVLLLGLTIVLVEESFLLWRLN